MFLAFNQCDNVYSGYLKNYEEDIGFSKVKLEVAKSSEEVPGAFKKVAGYH